VTPPQTARWRITGGLFLFAALVATIIAAAVFSEAFTAADRNLHRGTIYQSGYQVVTVRFSGGPTTTKIPYVKVRLDDGSTHTVESRPLFNLYTASRAPELNVDVQLDANGSPKRIRYHGTWYGAGPPVWFWIGFGVVLLVAAWLLGRAGVRRLRHPRAAPAAS
jgi:hypothetical protein